MRQNRISRLIALAVCGVIAASAYSQPASASAASDKRDQTAAMRVSLKWLTLYPSRFWVGVESPGACIPQPGGERRCPIAIAIKAWAGSDLVDHRCSAEAVLPRRGARGKATRTSARCAPVPVA